METKRKVGIAVLVIMMIWTIFAAYNYPEIPQGYLTYYFSILGCFGTIIYIIWDNRHKDVPMQDFSAKAVDEGDWDLGYPEDYDESSSDIEVTEIEYDTTIADTETINESVDVEQKEGSEENEQQRNSEELRQV